MSPRKSIPKSQRLLTETELEMMNVVWHMGQATVNEVLEALRKSRKLAYTSVSTILRILEQKEILTSRKDGRGHVYRPRLSKEAYEARSLNHLVERVFDGEPSAVVRCLLEAKGVNREDLKNIRDLLEERLDA